MGPTVDMGAYEHDGIPPSVRLNSPSPAVLWPPNLRPVAVTISGNVVDEQSGVDSAWLVVDDEYDELDDAIQITELLDENGDFEVEIELIASREGTDFDGRHYEISLHAVDKAGNEAEPVSVVVWVPHHVEP